jgi:hypothetical protein
MLGGSEHLVVASKEMELAEKAGETKCKVMSGDQTAGRRYRVKCDIVWFESVEGIWEQP